MSELQHQSPLIITDEIKENLKTISIWSKFLSILGFVGIGLMFIAGIVIIIAGAFIDNLSNEVPFSFTLIGVLYIILDVVYFFPTYYLFKSAIKLSSALNENNQEELNDGFKYLKGLYKFAGISTIVIIAFYILAVIAGIIISSLSLM
jgi:hypothetical protein